LYRVLISVIALIIVLTLGVSVVPGATADADYLVSLSRTSGPPGSLVGFSISIPEYFDVQLSGSITTDRWENYIGKRYLLLWDMDGGEEYQPQYWAPIGTADVDSNGLLWGEATIPNAVPGYHSIAAVYEHNDQYYMAWWKVQFIVTQGSGGSTTGGGGTTGGNGGDDPCAGFLVLLVPMGAVVLLKRGRRL
jgi:hypothetical protein